MTLKYDHLTGRPFTGIGEQDCFQLVREFFYDNFEIDIPNYARPNDWSADKLDLLRILPEMCGFETITKWRVKDLRPGDVLAVAIGEQNPNHLVVVLEDDKLVHHLYGRLSEETQWRDIWRSRTCFVLRHKDVPDLRPRYPDTTIEELLNARSPSSKE